jgi:hypothetical protein|tara:strand:- start:797 stop:1300 length:504 start_codon:yes stop_codon:yes gene_type:complete
VDDGIPDGEVGDQLPADLDPYGYVGPYQFPDNSRRRITGAIYLAVAVGVVVLVALAEDSPLLNGGVVVAAVGLAVLGLYHLQAGWPLGVDEAEALVVAIRCAGFPVGHASAQMAWRGLRSRPTWRILVYSNESPPGKRGLVVVDGVDGTVVASHIEDNPELWVSDGN